MTRHVYQPDGIPDHRGEDRCSYCQMPRKHANHDLPPAPPEQQAHRERIGEHE